ncbi:conserved hypothetical protein (plasmid) [Rhodococcus jostii RHA1]|uniref:Uncharacterized protein n=1 Tax=Rhodococcus jostii (strain RHA1) TaxID=101510 RepID=Q0RUT5_RHOJR|nr:hypothetical protein [Rhodococcus jostii]ABH00951.1 conserved hypothetical protein [Rhodococcus jostii RHA1]
MHAEPVIAESAYKHGIDSEDMVHAFNNAIKAYSVDEGFAMLIGPGRDASLIEVGYVTSSDGAHVIVHAMKARGKYLR